MPIRAESLTQIRAWRESGNSEALLLLLLELSEEKALRLTAAQYLARFPNGARALVGAWDALRDDPLGRCAILTALADQDLVQELYPRALRDESARVKRTAARILLGFQHTISPEVLFGWFCPAHVDTTVALTPERLERLLTHGTGKELQQFRQAAARARLLLAIPILVKIVCEQRYQNWCGELKRHLLAFGPDVIPAVRDAIPAAQPGPRRVLSEVLQAVSLPDAIQALRQRDGS